jgi:ribosomal protein S18 acetylase RimI-like enzyme
MSVGMSSLTIMNRENNQEVKCRLSWLTTDHIPSIIQLQQRVSELLSGSDAYYPQNADELLEMFQTKGMAIGAYLDHQLIGFHTALIPGDSEENLGLDLALSDKELIKVAHLENSSVDPTYRGNGLQQKMAKHIINRLSDTGEYRYLCETVAPDNLPSIKSTLANQLWIVSLKRKYGGFWRYLFLRDLVHPRIPSDTIIEWVKGTDYEKQIHLFDQNYYGVAVKREENKTMIGFVRDLP